jgi:hypothetical protein
MRRTKITVVVKVQKKDMKPIPIASAIVILVLFKAKRADLSPLHAVCQNGFCRKKHGTNIISEKNIDMPTAEGTDSSTRETKDSKLRLSAR